MAKVRCNDCRDYFDRTTLTWTEEDGWHALCDDCKLVPAATGPGEWKLIKIGGN